MWFKNIFAYVSTEALQFTEEGICEKLAQFPPKECTDQQESTFGWVPPFSDSDQLCEKVEGRYFICAEENIKEIKPAALNDLLNKKMAAIEAERGTRPGTKERQEIKDNVRFEMLPNIYPYSKRTRAFFTDKYLIVEASSEKAADSFTAHLREALGTLQVVPFGKANEDILHTLWIDSEQRPEGFAFESNLLFSLNQDSTVNAKFGNLSLESVAIQQCVDEGMNLNSAKVSFADQVTFVINKKWQFKSLKFTEKIIESAQDSEDPRTDAIIMSSIVCEMVNKFETAISNAAT